MVNLLGTTAFTYPMMGTIFLTILVMPWLSKRFHYAGKKIGVGELAVMLWFGFSVALLSYHTDAMGLGTTTRIKWIFAVINLFLTTYMLLCKLLKPILKIKKKSG